MGSSYVGKGIPLYANDINNFDRSAGFCKFADDTTTLTAGATYLTGSKNSHELHTLGKVATLFRQSNLNLNPYITWYSPFNSN